MAPLATESAIVNQIAVQRPSRDSIDRRGGKKHRLKLRSRCGTSFEVSDTLSELFFKLIAVLVEEEKQTEGK